MTLAKLADLVYIELVGPRGRTVMLPHVYAALPDEALEHTLVRVLSRTDLIRRLAAARRPR